MPEHVSESALREIRTNAVTLAIQWANAVIPYGGSVHDALELASEIEKFILTGTFLRTVEV